MELEDWNGVRVYAKYGKFNIGDEQALYRPEVGPYSGTAGDSITGSINLVTVLSDGQAAGGTTVVINPILT